MKNVHGRMLMAPLALLCLAAGAARADLVSWTYNWAAGSSSVAADGNGTGSINFSINPGGTIAGDSTISVANLSTASSATTAADTFTARPYSLTLTLTDGPSNATGQLTFAGHFDGTLTATSAAIQNTFDGPTTQTLQLGNDTYNVSIGPYAPPGAPTATLTGGISAFVSVNIPVDPVPLPRPVESAPEPSTLVLAALAVPLWGLAGRHRRK